MRVLVYASGSEWTGTARAAATYGRLLHASGATVTAAVRPETVVEERFATEGLDVVPLEGGTSFVGEVLRLRRIIRDYFIEVVLVSTPRAHRVAALAMRLAGRGAVLRRVPAGIVPVPTVADGMATWLATSLWLFASEAELRASSLPRRAQGLVVPLGVDLAHHDAVRPVARSAFHFSDGGPTVVCVGDHGIRRRASALLRAIHLLLPRHPALRLVFVGPGTDDENLRMHAAALGITRVVRFLGVRRDRLAILRGADLGWVLADGDAAAWGCLDLMALGVPVLAPAGTLAERYVADGITGALLPAADDGPGAAAEMSALLARPEARQAMGDAGRARAGRDFTEQAAREAIVRAVERARDRGGWRR